MLIRDGFGLGGRVATMANALSRYEQIGFVWRVNVHCPADHREIFPHGIPGVTFVEDAPLATATRWEGLSGSLWEAAADRGRADAAYDRIMQSMVGKAAPEAPAVALVGRFFRSPDADPVVLADAAAEVAVARGHRRVFVFADSRRGEIAARLIDRSITPVMPMTAPLSDDLSRTPQDMPRYAADWKTILAATVIVTCDGPTAALNPARARGVEILVTSFPKTFCSDAQ